MSEVVNIPQLRFPEFSGEWENEVVGNISNKVTDGTHDTPKPSSTGVPYITAIHVKDGVIDFDRCYYLSIEEHKKIYSRCNPEKNDILMVNIGAGTATTALINIDYEFSLKNVALIKPNKLKSSSKFLVQSLRYKSGRLHHQLTSGGAQPFLSLKEIKRIKLNLPTKPEQQKIADFLTAVDNKIEQLSKKQELLGEYKKGLMQQIFSQAIRFKADDGCDFPDWEEKSLGELFNYKNGGSFENEVVKDGLYNLITLNSITIDGELKNEHKKINSFDNSLKINDLIMVLSDVAHGNFLGLTAIIPEDNSYVLNQRMGALKSKGLNNVVFLRLLINYNQKYFKLHGQGSSQQNLSKGDILKFELLLPNRNEQQKIANFLSSIDTKIEQVGKQLDESKQFKKALLQQMFV